ncbi:hypothetical protein KY285_035301 [Solanum tuberosum]|nr:hypothetical protein KY285_035301 [Solanum tuberosum]
MDSPNEIDPVTFYTLSIVPSPAKVSTLSPLNTNEASPLNPQSPIDLNKPALSYQPGPFSTMLSDHLFEGDLPLSKSSGSNILAANESTVIESLAQMREGVIHEAGGTFANEEGGSFVEVIIGDTEPVLDQTHEIGLRPSTYSSDTDEDDVSLRLALQRRMVPITTKGKEKVTEETPKRRPFTRAISQKLIGDAMKSSEITTAENRRRRSGDMVFELPTDDVVDVSIEVSENEYVDEDTPLVATKKGKRKQVKKAGKGKSRTSTIKKANTTKGKGNDSQKKRELSKRKRETSPVLKQNSNRDQAPNEIGMTRK